MLDPDIKRILEYLSDVRIGEKKDISEFLNEYFPYDSNLSPSDYKNLQQQGAISRFLDTLRKYTLFPQEYRRELNFGFVQNMASLTDEGLQALEEEREKEKEIERQGALNRSIIESNEKMVEYAGKQVDFNRDMVVNSGVQATQSKIQTRVFKWTAIFAFGAMAIAVFNAWRDFHKDTQQQLLSRKDSLIRTLQKNIDRLKSDSSLRSKKVQNETKKP